MTTPEHHASLRDCQARLDLLADLNAEPADIFAWYDLARLPDAADLATAVGLFFEAHGTMHYDPPRVHPAAAWHIALEALPAPHDDALRRLCERWFFRASVLAAVPASPHRWNVVTSFLASLAAALGPCDAFRVEIAPPFMYAIEWKHVAFDAAGGRYLLSFNRSD